MDTATKPEGDDLESPQDYEAEMADARMLMLWGVVGLALGAGIGLHVGGTSSVVGASVCAMTMSIAVAALITALKRRRKRRAA
jgi:hypothetical protein